MMGEGGHQPLAPPSEGLPDGKEARGKTESEKTEQEAQARGDFFPIGAGRDFRGEIQTIGLQFIVGLPF